MKSALRRWLLTGLAAWERKPAAGAIPALTYHTIDESGSPISFPAAYLRAQLSWLAARGYRSLTAEQAATALAGEGPAVRSVVITFDDGFRSVADVGVPVLAEFGFVATVFCPAWHMGRRCTWQRAPNIPEFELMTWDDVRRLAGQGWEIGGHTVSHARLTELTDSEMRQEIGEGRRILEEQVGCQVTSFAYPYGAFDERCARATGEASYKSAWTMEPIINSPGSRPLTLGRFNCNRVQSDSPETAALAARVCLGGRYPYYSLLTARRLRLRRRPAKGR